MAKIALITGAGSGIGRQFAIALSKRSEVEEVWLVARNLDKLAAVADEIAKPTKIFSCDVSDKKAVSDFFEAAKVENPDFVWVINNAGYGKFCSFDDISPEESLSMIDTNCGGMVNFLIRSLPFMHRGSRMITTGSASAFQPLPYVALYAATKVFVRHYSRAVNRELKTSGITVTCICPYWVATDFFTRAHEHDGNSVVTKYEVLYRAEDVVAKAIKDAVRGRDMSVYGKLNKAQHLLAKLLPQRFVMWAFLKKQGLK